MWISFSLEKLLLIKTSLSKMLLPYITKRIKLLNLPILKLTPKNCFPNKSPLPIKFLPPLRTLITLIFLHWGMWILILPLALQILIFNPPMPLRYQNPSPLANCHKAKPRPSRRFLGNRPTLVHPPPPPTSQSTHHLHRGGNWTSPR